MNSRRRAQVDTRTRGVAAGALAGLVTGSVAGAAWFLVVFVTGSRQAFLMAMVGVAVAYGVFVGMHRPGRTAAIISTIVTLVVLVFASYEVERHMMVKLFNDSGDTVDIPIVPYVDWMAEMAQAIWRDSIALVIFGVIALVVAAFLGFNGFEHEHEPEGENGMGKPAGAERDPTGSRLA